MCLRPLLPVVPPPPLPAWLLADPDPHGWYRPEDYFAVEVVHDPVLDAAVKLECSRAFLRVHGERRLLEALDAAATVRDLPDCLQDVRDTLRVRAGRAA